MREFTVKSFDKGLINSIEDFSIPENAASGSLNWLTLGDRIELTGGYSIVGTESVGSGKITGLKVCTKVDGNKVVFRTHGKKLDYTTDAVTWTEVGTDLLGTDADGEDISMTIYTSLAGYQMWLSSQNAGLYKFLIANPGSYRSMNNPAKNFLGYIEAQNNRLHLWNRETDKNSLYGSYKDLQNSTVYTTVTGEAVGAAGGTVYSGTLASVTGVRTGFNVVFRDSAVQTIQDDKNGNLYGDGTGTINYVTGAYSVTFNTVTANPVTVDYQYEESDIRGLADFTYSSPRTASQGYVVSQPIGGDLLNILQYEQNFYCLHENAVWIFVLDTDDLTVTNEIYRVNIGTSNWRASVATGDGVYFIDTTTPTEPRFKLLTLEKINNRVIPTVFSYNVDLENYNFDSSAAFEWGKYLLFACRTSDSSSNNRMFAYNKEYESFDQLDYFAHTMDNYNGFLWCGDSMTNNVYQAFTGFSSNETAPQNYWEGKLSKLEVDELKKYKRLTVRGQIGIDQVIEVSLAYDDGSFTTLGSILGTGDYVSTEASVLVGSPQVGSLEVGGGGGGIEAFEYTREFLVRSDRFDEVKIRFEAKNVGYASVSEFNFNDIKTYGQKNILKFRTTT